MFYLAIILTNLGHYENLKLIKGIDQIDIWLVRMIGMLKSCDKNLKLKQIKMCISTIKVLRYVRLVKIAYKQNEEVMICTVK